MSEEPFFRHRIRISMHSYFLDIALSSKKEVKALQEKLKEDIAAGFYTIGEEPYQEIIMNRHNEVHEGEDADRFKGIINLDSSFSSMCLIGIIESTGYTQS